jgi:DNA-binding transcriptional ArsR family regulator
MIFPHGESGDDGGRLQRGGRTPAPGAPDPLAGGEKAVNDLAGLLGLAQPQVSKHLRVLREVGAVQVRDQGRRRLYRLNGQALKPIHDWVSGFERAWSERFDELDLVLEDLRRDEQGAGNDGP